jgi:hypothetical protein
LISGGGQTVAVARSGLTDLPEPVVVYVANNGVPVANADVHAAVWVNTAPGPNGAAYFVTDANGIASMNLQTSYSLGPFTIDVAYVVCTREGFFGCDRYTARARLTTTGTAVALTP